MAKTTMHIMFGVSLILLSTTRAVGQNCCQ